MGCVLVARRAWPEFKERESIYHIFCKFFNQTCFVCEHDVSVAAFLLGFISQVDHTQAYIHLVAVDPAWQRQRLASQLYEKFFQRAGTDLPHCEVGLIVNPDNAGSLAFHEKLGFRPNVHGETISIDGVLAVKDYNGPGHPMVPFSRPLV